MEVLVTGGAGFVGSVLVPMLLRRGCKVRVVDTGMFGLESLPAAIELIKGDVCEFKREWAEGVDAIVHLAGLSNEPMAEIRPDLNYLINCAGTAIVADAAKAVGVKRFVFASTCSVYGLADEDVVDETFQPKPRFSYGISKLMAERGLLCMEDKDFRPICLRKGTVIGWSPRMRFDLVLNTMIKSALTQGKITVHNPSLWRPLLEVRDAAEAYIRALDADLSLTGIFNVAHSNYTIGRLADEIADTLGEFEVNVTLDIQRRSDVRSYRVSTSKAEESLDFRPKVSMKEAVREIMRHIREGEIPNLNDPRFVSVEWMKLLMARGELRSPVMFDGHGKETVPARKVA